MRVLSNTGFAPKDAAYIYNGLDCCITHEVLEETLPPGPNITYDFSRMLQAPILEMMLRGIAVDTNTRWGLEQGLQRELTQLQAQLMELVACAGFKATLKFSNSPAQLKDFFYSYMGLPKQYKNPGHKVSCDREALETLSIYFYARPFTSHILAIRDRVKLLSVLRKGLQEDGRIHTSYNIGGTETGRLSSSSDAFGCGDNLQNWTERVRQVCTVDPGMKMAYVDLEQAESRAVAYLAQDLDYIEACESGDPHTMVCTLVWKDGIKDQAWTGALSLDRKLADTPFYRHFSHRDIGKRAGHATNYRGQAFTVSKVLKVPQSLIQDFQDAYMGAFPGIPRWHHEVAQAIQTTQTLTTPLGRVRQFFGRSWDDATLREAIAYVPQSLVADILNNGMLAVWKAGCCQLLAQVHDAILIQYPEEDEDKIIPLVQRLLEVPVTIHGRTMLIPSDAQVGWNWGHAGDTNPDGLTLYKGPGQDDRTRTPTSTSLLARRVL